MLRNRLSNPLGKDERYTSSHEFVCVVTKTEIEGKLEDHRIYGPISFESQSTPDWPYSWQSRKKNGCKQFSTLMHATCPAYIIFHDLTNYEASHYVIFSIPCYFQIFSSQPCSYTRTIYLCERPCFTPIQTNR
jgi:hypothetical protein